MIRQEIADSDLSSAGWSRRAGDRSKITVVFQSTGHGGGHQPPVGLQFLDNRFWANLVLRSVRGQRAEKRTSANERSQPNSRPPEASAFADSAGSLDPIQQLLRNWFAAMAIRHVRAEAGGSNKR